MLPDMMEEIAVAEEVVDPVTVVEMEVTAEVEEAEVTVVEVEVTAVEEVEVDLATKF